MFRGLGFRGLGFRIWGLGFRVWNSCNGRNTSRRSTVGTGFRV